jgi:hypothetical protein
MTSRERRKVIPDDGGRTRFETCCVAMEKEAPLVKPSPFTLQFSNSVPSPLSSFRLHGEIDREQFTFFLPF